MPKQEKLLSKIIIVLFTLMIVAGFSIPLFNLGEDADTAPRTEQRLCQTDADCYLNCGTDVVPAVCFQNLCQQNSCEEYSYFQYSSEPLVFELRVNLLGETLNLSNHANTLDVFVTFSGTEVQSFSPGLPLGYILDKAGMALDDQCIKVSTTRYCNDGSHELQLIINGNRSYSYSQYVPAGGDMVEIVYSYVKNI